VNQGRSKITEKIYKCLKEVIEGIYTEDLMKTFILNIYEILDLYHKISAKWETENQDKPSAWLQNLIALCFYHQAIRVVDKSFDSSTLLKKTEDKPEPNSASEISQAPSLARLISFEETSAPNPQIASLQRSYSSYRKEADIDYDAIFANFGLKFAKVISAMSQIEDSESQPSRGFNTAMSVILPNFPWILDLDAKRRILWNKVVQLCQDHNIQDQDDRSYLTIKRKDLIHSAIKEISNIKKKDLMKNLQISYDDEQGYDAGGLRREFYKIVCEKIFDPRVGLFRVSDNGRNIQPSPFSSLVPDHLVYMEFAGFVLAKAIQDKMVLDLNFTKPFLKHLIGKKITIADLEDIDADLGKNLQWMLHNHVEDLGLTFTYETQFLGERISIELQEGGSGIDVDEGNKKQYVKEVCETAMTKQINQQLQIFLKGFQRILPKGFLSFLSTAEFEIIISGSPTIDFEEMKKHAQYTDYDENSKTIIWLWEILGEFSQQNLATFYYFLSGSTKVPHGGFKDHPISINKVYEEGLPVGHTCSYSIDLPDYESKEKLQEKLLIAIFEGTEGFFIS